MKRLSTVSQSLFAFITPTFALDRFQYNVTFLFPLTSLVAVRAVVRSKSNFFYTDQEQQQHSWDSSLFTLV